MLLQSSHFAQTSLCLQYWSHGQDQNKDYDEDDDDDDEVASCLVKSYQYFDLFLKDRT